MSHCAIFEIHDEQQATAFTYSLVDNKMPFDQSRIKSRKLLSLLAFLWQNVTFGGMPNIAL